MCDDMEDLQVGRVSRVTGWPEETAGRPVREDAMAEAGVGVGGRPERLPCRLW